MDGGDYGVNMPNIKDLQSSIGGRTFGDISECRSAEKKSKLNKLTAMSKNTTFINSHSRRFCNNVSVYQDYFDACWDEEYLNDYQSVSIGSSQDLRKNIKCEDPKCIYAMSKAYSCLAATNPTTSIAEARNRNMTKQCRSRSGDDCNNDDDCLFADVCVKKTYCAPATGKENKNKIKFNSFPKVQPFDATDPSTYLTQGQRTALL